MTNNVNSNITVSSGLLASGTEFYRLPSGSPAINYGVGTYSYLTKDILGGNREVAFDAGAEEYGASGAKGPYKLVDVGLKIGFGALNALSVSQKNKNMSGIKIYPNPSIDELNVSSEIAAIQSLKIFDIAGKLLLKRTINSNTVKIDVKIFSKGVYVIDIDGFKSRFIVK